MKRANFLIIVSLILMLLAIPLVYEWTLEGVGLFDLVWFPFATYIWKLLVLAYCIVSLCFLFMLYLNHKYQFSKDLNDNSLAWSVVVNIIIFSIAYFTYVICVGLFNTCYFMSKMINIPFFLLSIFSLYLQFKYINQYFFEYCNVTQYNETISSFVLRELFNFIKQRVDFD